MDHPKTLRLPHAAGRLRIMFLAKHALSGGGLDPEDGSHAVYHHELRTTLEGLGLEILPENRFEALFERPQVDFVVPLLNRAGFVNSEMLAPLLLGRQGVPYLGASPILRGLGDDKHLMKQTALALRRAHRALDRAPSGRGAPLSPPPFRAERYVVKPNASSASWGVKITDDLKQALEHGEDLLAQGHDVILEPWVPMIDVAVPVVGGRAGPWLLPPMAYLPEDPTRLRSYEEKRNLVPTGDDPLSPLTDMGVVRRLNAHVEALLPDLWPFDYGRFEFRFDPGRGTLSFMEVNLSCNLWSRKTISRSAATLGVDHATLVETILASSLARQGILDVADARWAA